jgi:hypothetical protein
VLPNNSETQVNRIDVIKGHLQDLVENKQRIRGKGLLSNLDEVDAISIYN